MSTEKVKTSITEICSGVNIHFSENKYTVPNSGNRAVRLLEITMEEPAVQSFGRELVSWADNNNLYKLLWGDNSQLSRITSLGLKLEHTDGGKLSVKYLPKVDSKNTVVIFNANDRVRADYRNYELKKGDTIVIFVNYKDGGMEPLLALDILK